RSRIPSGHTGKSAPSERSFWLVLRGTTQRLVPSSVPRWHRENRYERPPAAAGLDADQSRMRERVQGAGNGLAVGQPETIQRPPAELDGCRFHLAFVAQRIKPQCAGQVPGPAG